MAEADLLVPFRRLHLSQRGLVTCSLPQSIVTREREATLPVPGRVRHKKYPNAQGNPPASKKAGSHIDYGPDCLVKKQAQG